jgi:hypothetical protein
METRKNQNRLFSNKKIQQKIFDKLRLLPESELSKYCDKSYSKKQFNIDFPLLMRASKNLSKVEKREPIRNQNVNRWTRKFEIEHDNYSYVISTQWYPHNDKYVRDWLRNFQ